MSTPPRIILAPDTFKGSLSAAGVARAVGDGVRQVYPDAELRFSPVADGGDGTVDAVIEAGFSRARAVVSGPVGTPVAATFAHNAQVAVIEAAAACGLTRLRGHRAPMTATSRGVGELIRAALDAGHRHIVLGVGGSACSDGGAGMLAGLGARLLDRRGNPVPDGGIGLAEGTTLDVSGMDPRLADTEVILACDVDNPLLGPDGAASVFGPQKGADSSQVVELEHNLTGWARLVTQQSEGASTDTPGAGAAGGIGFAALAVLGARRVAGAAYLLDPIGFDDTLDGADLVVTGEGSLDEQSLRGKAPIGVAARAGAAGIPVVAVAGRCTPAADRLRAAGVARVYPLTDIEPDMRRCHLCASALLTEQGRRIATEWATGPFRASGVSSSDTPREGEGDRGDSK